MSLQILTPAYITQKNKWQAINLYDELKLTLLAERKIQLLKSKGHKMPTNHLSPIYQVAAALLELKTGKVGVKIEVKKNIPSFSGLHSQAGNAAGAMIALNQLWDLNLNEKDLLGIAKRISPAVAKALTHHFNPPDSKIKHVVLIKLKYIRRKENKVDPKKALEHFPDLRIALSLLRDNGIDTNGITGSGPMLFGFSKNVIDTKSIQKQLGKKIELIQTGLTCNGEVKLLH